VDKVVELVIVDSRLWLGRAGRSLARGAGRLLAEGAGRVLAEGAERDRSCMVEVVIWVRLGECVEKKGSIGWAEWALYRLRSSC
jgi:hypothetical protein